MKKEDAATAIALATMQRGTKRRCGKCEAPFYDMQRQPIQCPKCGAAYVETAGRRLPSGGRRPKPPKPVPVTMQKEGANAAAKPESPKQEGATESDEAVELETDEEEVEDEDEEEEEVEAEEKAGD